MLSPCFVMLSSFAIISLGKRELVALLFYSCLHHPHGAIGWYAVCECGISRLHVYSLTLYDQNNRALGPWIAYRRMTNQWSGTIRVHHEEQFCEIVLNLGQWFKRRCRLKDFLSRALTDLLFGAAEPFMQF